jgi:Holliday junction resolvase RusA-like endonuclease
MANISIPARLAADTPQSQPYDAIFYYGIPRGFRRWMVRNTMDTDLIKAITDIITRGGVTEDGCAILVNNEAVRVVYKNNYGFGVKIFNIYMVR